jgi:hypothetical protein
MVDRDPMATEAQSRPDRPIRSLIISILLSLMGIPIAAYAAEWVLTMRSTRDQIVSDAAKRAGRPFDSRSVKEVVEQSEKAGKPLLPCCVTPLSALGDVPDTINTEHLIPMAPPSNAAHVMCNESGPHIFYTTDEHGFANPPGVWKQDVPLVTIGDSFTQGLCVEPKDHWVNLLRPRIPGVVNLGVRNTGSLSQLATLREYGPYLRPKLVLWAVFDNDMEDLGIELRYPGMKRYLDDPEYSQHLIDRQEAVDRIGRYAVKASAANAEEVARTEKFSSILRLRQLRARLIQTSLRPPGLETDFAALKNVLSSAKKTVAAWGGTIRVVYLPGYYQFAGRVAEYSAMRQRVLQLAQEQGFPVTDVHEKLAAHPNPVSLFFYPNSHYTEEGNKLVSDRILTDLTK